MNKLAKALRNARLERSLSLRDIQKLSYGAITNTHVMNIERGQIPSPKKLRVLAKILKLEFIELMVMAGHVDELDLKPGEK